MRPTLHLGMPLGDIRWKSLSGPMQGFDAVRLVAQIVSLQCLHYLVLAFFLPPLLGLFTWNKYALDFQGGVASLSLLLDWREIASYPVLNGGRPWTWNWYSPYAALGELEEMREAGANTSDVADGRGNRYFWEYEAFVQLDQSHFEAVKDAGLIAWDGQRLGAASTAYFEKARAQQKLRQMSDLLAGKAADPRADERYEQSGWWEVFAQDSSRGWVIAVAWAFTGGVDVFLLATLIRRPTHILDHTITLHILHLLLTWSYTRQFPNSLFYWLVMAVHVGVTVVWAEALSIRREIRTGWQSGLEANHGRDEEERTRFLDRNNAAANGNGSGHGRPSMHSQPHVLFGEGDDVQDDEKAEKKERIEMKRFN